jgi:hypothetical protein
MQNISDLFPVTPLIGTNVAALAFLLCALAAFIKALVSRIDRVIDRSRYIHENDSSKPFLRAELPQLKLRAACAAGRIMPSSKRDRMSRALTSGLTLSHRTNGGMVKIILAIVAILMLSSSSATAQRRLAIGDCAADLRKLCPDIPPGNDRLRACMREHLHDVSFPCLETLGKFAEVDESRSDCSAHLQQQCASVERGGEQFAACLRSAVASLSDTCKDALARAVHRTHSGN